MKKWLTNFSVARKLAFIMFLASVVVAGGTLFFIIATHSLSDEFDTFEVKSFEGVNAVLRTEKELNYFSRITREIMLGGDLNTNLAKMDDTVSTIEDLFSSVEQSISDGEQRTLYENAKRDALVFLTSSRDLMYTLKDGSQDPKSIYPFYHSNFSPIAKMSRESMKKLVESKTNEAHAQKDAFKSHIFIWGIVAGGGGVAGIMILIVIMLMVTSQIKESLSKTEEGLIGFFRFLGGKTKHAQPLEKMGKDEFGEMGKVINENIASLELKFKEQQQALIDIDRVCTDAGKGFLYHRVSTGYSDETLNSLARSLNNMLDETENTFNDVIKILIDVAQGNYKNNATSSSAKGAFASIENALLSVTVSSSEIFALISRFSREFNRDAATLAGSGDELSTSANLQAASLEETAAAIEELTSNIASNAAKADEMAKVAQESKAAAESGNTAAQESFHAMHEIVTATEAINQTVDIIDNIAFQTNILSLNAAVEAATAGEAGKGFAVVAQEVRNLANRSAEAAKLIQDLARAARDKSRGGLEISQNMMEGFSLIAEKITRTDNMVRDVASANREQMAGIAQINNAVGQLDQMTQQNAKTAGNVAVIANEILHKTEQFEQMLSRVSYDAAYEKQSCSASMIFDMAKLKIDHVNFKEDNYRKLKSATSAWKVTGHHDCNLGKWIDAHSHEPFARTEEWKTLLAAHERVHNGVQSHIEADMAHASSDVIDRLSQNIEEATREVFKGIDHVKSNYCTTET